MLLGRAVRFASDGKTFRVISAGSDGIFQSDISAGGKLQSFAEDAVIPAILWLFRHGEFK